jgi:serine/threonine protein kinase
VLAGRYVVRARIGAGGMGVVFLADQPALGRTVAIKVLHPALASDPSFARRFRDEARAASRVRHAGSVAILDCDVTDDGTPFIAMEHVAGRPLSKVIAEQELSLPRVLSIAGQILRALEAVHARGVIHADVKSDNFLIDERLDGDAVTLIDFGLAMLDGVWVSTGFVSGTPEYLAPELIRGEPPAIASDLYGAGVILYEMLTGAAPFTGDTSGEVLSRQLQDEVIAPSLRQPERGIPPVLDEIVLRALEKDPQRRFASAGELAAALRAVGGLCEAPALPRYYTVELARASADTPTRNCGSPRRPGALTGLSRRVYRRAR